MEEIEHGEHGGLKREPNEGRGESGESGNERDCESEKESVSDW